ncbi:DUF624 domain-containing protein [Pseudogracilibacillus auburnensis]|uniref:Putative membrane protein YesL n=1 Tax=Pseudogracilibacillus auburnensis TaxID=1494959 RepID=A0A2V3W719_9BACI|nr:putative membrane protein YesL [Pseudogracilibacillus auburnensis]
MQGTQKYARFIYSILEWILNLSIINLMWLLMNIPLIYFIVYTLYMSTNPFVVVMPALLTVLFFFPATTALYSSIRECLIHKESRASMKGYLRFYIKGYKRSLLIGLIVVPFWVAFLFNMYLSFTYHYVVIGICIFFISLLFFVYTNNLFIVESHYVYRLKELFIHTLLITFGNVKLFISIILSAIFVVSVSALMSKTIFTLFFVFFSTSLFALFSFSLFYSTYTKIVPTKKEE